MARAVLLVALLGTLAAAGVFVYSRTRQDATGGGSIDYAQAEYDPWTYTGLGGAYDGAVYEGESIQVEDTPIEGDASGGGVVDSFLSVGYALNSMIGGKRMNISINGVDRIKEHEALRLTKYRDQGGLWTIGYGHLIGPFESFPGAITEERALTLLVKDLADAESAVNALVSVAITQEQYDALVSLVFNIGAGNFRKSRLLKRLNAGDVQGAAAEFSKWNKVSMGGQLVASAGLSARRAAEAALFQGMQA